MRNSSSSSALYSDVAQPKSSKELAVHNKKIAEVKKWLQTTKSGHPNVLLLTGPSGSGKSTTVEVLAKELQISLISYESEQLFDENLKLKTEEIDDFCRFLRQSGARLGPQRGRTPVLYVSSLPDQAYNDIIFFREKLSETFSNIQVSIVFCLSDVQSSWIHHPNRLFSPQFIQENCINWIKFNSLAVTFLKRALNEACNKLSISIPISKIDEIVRESEGDLRLALNILQFNSIGSNPQKRRRSQSGILVSARANREETFHMLGRILYAKRLPQSTEKSSARPELEHDVNEIIKMSTMNGTKVLAFLHEHEAKFLENISSLRKVVDTFSLCDSMVGDWSTRMTLNHEYLSQISARTVMWYNYEKQKTEWRSLCGPKMSELDKEIETTLKELRKSNGIGNTQRNILSFPYESIMFPFDNSTNIKYYLTRPMSMKWIYGRESIYSQLEKMSSTEYFKKQVEHSKKFIALKSENENEEESNEDEKDEEIIIEDSDKDDSFD